MGDSAENHVEKKSIVAVDIFYLRPPQCASRRALFSSLMQNFISRRRSNVCVVSLVRASEIERVIDRATQFFDTQPISGVDSFLGLGSEINESRCYE